MDKFSVLGGAHHSWSLQDGNIPNRMLKQAGISLEVGSPAPLLQYALDVK